MYISSRVRRAWQGKSFTFLRKGPERPKFTSPKVTALLNFISMHCNIAINPQLPTRTLIIIAGTLFHTDMNCSNVTADHFVLFCTSSKHWTMADFDTQKPYQVLVFTEKFSCQFLCLATLLPVCLCCFSPDMAQLVPQCLHLARGGGQQKHGRASSGTN